MKGGSKKVLRKEIIRSRKGRGVSKSVHYLLRFEFKLHAVLETFAFRLQYGYNKATSYKMTGVTKSFAVTKTEK